MKKIVNKESLILSAIVLVAFTLGVFVGCGCGCKCWKGKRGYIKHSKQIDQQFDAKNVQEKQYGKKQFKQKSFNDAKSFNVKKAAKDLKKSNKFI